MQIRSIQCGFALTATAFLFFGDVVDAQSRAQPQPSENVATFDKACGRNDYDACRKLGVLFAFGQSVPVNRSAAARLLAKACNGDAKTNCTTYGMFLQGATGGKPDYAGAMAAFGKACDAGDGDGCEKLSHHYVYGWGVAKNAEQANRLLKRSCELDKRQCRTTASPPAAAPAPTSKSATPSTQSQFSMFGARLGADRFREVQAMLDRNRADYFDYFDGTTALNDETRKVVARRLVVSDARFAGISARGARVWFDFANETDPVLSTVTVIYGPGKTGLKAERVAAMIRQYGADDGRGGEALWHRVVPGAEIALFADSRTGAIIESYVYSKE